MGSANFKKGGSVWELKKRDIQGQQPLNSLFLTMMGHCWVPTKSIRWGGNAIPTLARPLGRKSCVHFFFAPRTSLRIRSLHTDSPMYHYIYIYIYIFFLLSQYNIIAPLSLSLSLPSDSQWLSHLQRNSKNWTAKWGWWWWYLCRWFSSASHSGSVATSSAEPGEGETSGPTLRSTASRLLLLPT